MAEAAAPEALPVATFVGIDLSSFQLVVSCSSIDEPSAVAVAVNEVSNRATPAAVGFDGNLRLVGEAAETRVSQMPKQVVTALPAMLGSKATAQTTYDNLGCQWNFTDGKVGPVEFGGKSDVLLPPAACLAALLQKLASYATPLALPTFPVEGVEPAPATQTFELAAAVPDAWTEAELGTFRAALDILGWKTTNISALPYSAAVATAYAQRIGQKLPEGEEQRVVAFLDMGYTQTTVSIIALTRPEGEEAKDLAVEVKAKATVDGLGTHGLFSALLEHFNKIVQGKGQDPVKLSSKRGARLKVALQKGVKDLSMLPDTTVALECFFADESDLKVDLSQAQFEDIVQPQMQKVADLAKQVLAEAGVTQEQVHSVELVGGGTRIPKVKAILSAMFPDDVAEGEEAEVGKGYSSRLRNSLDGASAIATGAAHWAAGHRAIPSKWDLAAQASVLSEEELATCHETEAWISKVDREEVLRLEKGNELESYIYQVRSWFSGPDRALLKPETTEPIVEETFRWFEDAQYEETTTLQMYEERLGGLKRHLEDHGNEYFEKKRCERETKEKEMDEQAERERQRRHDTGMDVDKDDRKMAKSERLKMAAKNKDEGNTVFKAGNLEDAEGRYMRSLQHLKKYFMLDLSPDEKAEGDAIGLSCHLNMAQVFIKQATLVEKDAGKAKAEEKWQKAKNSAEEALKIDADNVKARFRKATALEKLGDIDTAMKEVKSALKTDEENADLKKFKERLDKLQAQQKEKAKKMYGKMFG